MLAPNAEIAGRYRVVRTIGRGGMGVVYEVEHVNTGQRLALKVLIGSEGAHRSIDPESLERFKREARASGKIKSEHVVRVTDADVAPELDGAPFFVMELLEGIDLRAATANTKPTRADVVEWLRQAARGLSRAHALGIVHRDLKPENLFLTHRDDGAPLIKILDFGIAKTAADANVRTQSGQILGTPMYMAPEQAMAGGAPITPKTDLYALGLIAFRLLTGEYFWRDGTLAALVGQLLYNPMEAPSKRFPALGAEFDAWFARACARDPAERFSSAPEQIEALAIALGLPVGETSTDRSGGQRVVLPIESTALEMAKTFDVSTPAPLPHARTLDSSASAISTNTKPRKSNRLALFALLGVGIVGATTLFVLKREPRVPAVPASAAQPTPIASPTPSGAPSVSASAAPTPSATPASAPMPSAIATMKIAPKASAASTPSASVAASASPPAPSSTTKPLDPLADQK